MQNSVSLLPESVYLTASLPVCLLVPSLDSSMRKKSFPKKYNHNGNLKLIRINQIYSFIHFAFFLFHSIPFVRSFIFVSLKTKTAIVHLACHSLSLHCLPSQFQSQLFIFPFSGSSLNSYSITRF